MRQEEENEQRNGWCSSNKEVGLKQLHILGIQDAPVPARAWLLELHPWRKRSRVRIGTQGSYDVGAGNM